jgi:hypothetical protein
MKSDQFLLFPSFYLKYDIIAYEKIAYIQVFLQKFYKNLEGYLVTLKLTLNLGETYLCVINE